MPELLQNGNIKSKNISVFALFFFSWSTSLWYFPLISQYILKNSLSYLNYIFPLVNYSTASLSLSR